MAVAAVLLLGVVPAVTGAPAPHAYAVPGSHCPAGPPCGWQHDGPDGDPDDHDGRDGDDDPDVPAPPSVRTVGQVSVAQANIPPRSGKKRFRRGIRQVTAGLPDFVTLNEQFNHSVGDITRVAAGYDGFRVAKVPRGRDGWEALSTVVLWRAHHWSFVRGGRIRLVNDDRTWFRGRKVRWDRFATWATLRSRASGEVVSVVSVHHMTNPAKYGPRKKRRQQAYRKGMNRLVRLSAELGRHRRPVLLGGDFNTHAGQRQPWSAAVKMSRAGFRWHASGVDFVFFPADRGLRLTQACTLKPARRVSDHPFLVARVALNATGLAQRARSVC